MPREILRQGEPLTRQVINSIIPQALKSIFAGPGIRIVPTSDTICIMSDNKNSFTPGLGGGTGGGGGYSPAPVLSLPPLPSGGYNAVFWCGVDSGQEFFEEDGTGDDQIWTCRYPQDRYFPQDKVTFLSGIPLA